MHPSWTDAISYVSGKDVPPWIARITPEWCAPFVVAAILRGTEFEIKHLTGDSPRLASRVFGKGPAGVGITIMMAAWVTFNPETMIYADWGVVIGRKDAVRE